MIRHYTSKDKKELLTLLELNTPQYFAASEKNDFIAYLEQYTESYYVVEESGKIIGSGGINYPDDPGIARISWDIIHPDFQGQGIGKKLTLFRIDEIKKNPDIDLIVVRTSQLAYKFYQKSGFEIEKIEKDFWAKGFDLYQMRLVLKKG